MPRLIGIISQSPARARLALGLFDAACVLLCAALVSVTLVQPAYAYVDPSVMTYTIQALAGVVVALSALAGVVIRRARRKMVGALNIDENARKDIDYKFERIDPSKENLTLSPEALGNERPAKKGRTPKQEKPAEEKPQFFKAKLGRRLLLGLAVSAFAVITLLVLAPYETLAGSASSLQFGLLDLWQPIAITACIVTLVFVVIFAVLRGSVFNACLIVLFGFGLGCYLQAMILNGTLPTTDGRAVSWDVYRDPMLISLAVWLIIMIVPFELSRLNRKVTQSVVGVVAAGLFVVQLTAAVSLVTNAAATKDAELQAAAEGEEVVYHADDYIMSDRDMFTVSPGKNVIVFVLDTYDTQDMVEVLRDEPSFADRLAGFTWFKNSVGSMAPTRYGAPYLLTGEYPKEGEPFEDYIAERYKRSSYLDDLSASNYSIGIYTDTIGDYLMSESDRRTLIYDKTVNITPPKPGEMEPPKLTLDSAIKKLVRCACYRDLPWFAKPFFYITTDELNQAMVDRTEAERKADAEAEVKQLRPYVMDDAQWYEDLKQGGLSYENHDDAGAFRFIHLVGTHQPYVLDAYGNRTGEFALPGAEEAEHQQAIGSLRMVLDYIDQLKQLGVFDDATIIITADHGIWFEKDDTDLLMVSSPLMLVKQGGTGVDAGPLKESDDPIIAHDVLATVISAVGGDASAYGTTLFDQHDPNRERTYLMDYCAYNVDLLIAEYRIEGDVLDPSSWVRSGREWDPSNTPH